MATLKARETLHLPAGAKARAMPTTGRLVARAKLKRNKPRVKPGDLVHDRHAFKASCYRYKSGVEYPIK